MQNFCLYLYQGEPSSRVHGHIQNGVFDGEIVQANGEKYHIELAEKYFQDSDELDFHSVIYSIKDVRFTVEGQESSCGVKKDLLNKMAAIQATAKPIRRPHKIRSQIDRKKSTKTLSEYLRSKRKLDKRTSDLTVDGGQYCQIFIAADHTFLSNIGGGSESRAISEIATVFASVQSIYFESDFDEDGTPDEIVPVLVQTEILSSSSYNGLFQSSNIAVDDYLDRWSQINQEDFCLALLLTYRSVFTVVILYCTVCTCTVWYYMYMYTVLYSMNCTVLYYTCTCTVYSSTCTCILYYTVLYCTMCTCTLWYYTVLYSMHCTILYMYSIVLHVHVHVYMYTLLYSTVLYYNVCVQVQYGTILYCTVLYCTVLYYTCTV